MQQQTLRHATAIGLNIHFNQLGAAAKCRIGNGTVEFVVFQEPVYGCDRSVELAYKLSHYNIIIIIIIQVLQIRKCPE
jgi:hypothetical protein